MLLEPSDLPAYAHGCGLLAGGGCGDTRMAEIVARAAMQRFGPVQVVDLDELPADALVVPCGIAGSPPIANEKLFAADEAERLVEEVERLMGRPAAALMPFELAGANGLYPVAWASRVGLPLVDADGMGRAFPLTPQMMMNIAGISSSPCILTDERANTLVIRSESTEWAEELLRAALTIMGGVAAAGMYLMSADQAREATIRGTVTRALEIGRSVTAAADRVQAALAATGGVELIVGKVVDVERRSSGGFVSGCAIVQDAVSDGSRPVRLELQNENLMALEDGRLLAVVPDVITVLDAETGDVIASDRLRYGQRVSIVAFPAPPIWRTARGLELVGPAAFGFDTPFVPVEELHAHAP